jgi:hypothetical protein
MISPKAAKEQVAINTQSHRRSTSIFEISPEGNTLCGFVPPPASCISARMHLGDFVERLGACRTQNSLLIGNGSLSLEGAFAEPTQFFAVDASKRQFRRRVITGMGLWTDSTFPTGLYA